MAGDLLFLHLTATDAFYVANMFCFLFVCFVISGGFGKMGTPWGRYDEVERI